MKSVKAAIAASRACCIGSETDVKYNKGTAGPSRHHRNSTRAAPGRRPSEKNHSMPSSVTAARWRCTASISMTRARKCVYSGCANVGAAMEFTPAARSLCGHFSVAVTVPGHHQGTPTLEQIAAAVASFDRALDAMAERLLHHLMRKACSLVAPLFQT